MQESVLKDAFETRREMARAPSRGSVVDALARFARDRGLPHVLLAAVRPGAREPEFTSTTLPLGAANALGADGVAFEAMLVAAVQAAGGLVTLSDRLSTLGMSSALMELASIGVADGLVLPLGDVGGLSWVLCCFATKRESLLHDHAGALIALVMLGECAARRVLLLQPDGTRPRGLGPDVPHRPTQRELACLSHSSRGMSSMDIAVELRLSEHTVNTHLRAAIEKLRAKSRVQAVADALRRGWID